MPPESKKDPEVIALEAVHAALKPLDFAARQRVLSSVYALLEIPFAALHHPVQSGQGSQSTIPKPSEAGAKGLGFRPMSPVELIREKKPKTNTEKITLFAYYREMYEGLPRFSRSDLEAYFGKAKEKPSGNYGRDFVEAIKKGWLHEDGSDSYITSKGVEAVEAGFPEERPYSKPMRSLQPLKSKKKSTKTK